MAEVTIGKSSQHGARLRVLNPDLPLLASQAAIELDKLSQGHNVGFKAVSHLSSLLENSIECCEDSKPSRSLMDSATVTVVSRALDAAQWGEPTERVEQLVKQAWEITNGLKTPASTRVESVKKMRDFCAALSRCATAHIQSLNELRPIHPYRK